MVMMVIMTVMVIGCKLNVVGDEVEDAMADLKPWLVYITASFVYLSHESFKSSRGDRDMSKSLRTHRNC